jgi:CubicO group peptidase (beta-lactamase class C family)
MDGARLEAAVAAAQARGLALHAFLVVRHGKLVLERYGTRAGRQLTPADDHEVYSTTKTFTGMLVGLALADGKLASVRAPVMPFFEGAALADRSPEKDGLVLEDLLTMRSGLEYEEGRDHHVFGSAACAAEAFLGRPLVAAPGKRWSYSTADSQILAEIVRRATGKTPLALAQERIFAPLGIAGVRWQADGGGTQFGGFGLSLRPRDLARFGQLLLARGSWNGAQLVPAEWVEAATRPHAETPWAGGSYGYQCWIPRLGGFATRGYQGQDMYVFPERDLIVVFNGELPYQSADPELDRLVSEFVLPAVADRR